MTMEYHPFSWLVKRGIDWLGKGKLAKTSGRLRLHELQGRVEIIRDHWGVPHIYAENEQDLFFAQGFVHAQDRFWQMEFQRRLVAGRLSELVGEAGLFADRWMRVLGMAQVAEDEVNRLQGAEGMPLEAYTAGVNSWLKSRQLPVEFTLLRMEPELWRTADSLAWSKMMAWFLSSNWECELLRQQIGEKLSPEEIASLELETEDHWPLVLALPDMLGLEKNMSRLARPWSGPGAGEGVGSNNWVISGARTESGLPILANDMHLLLGAPAFWYENHLVCGDLNVSGVSLPGLPLVVSGHNGHVAWGFTAGFADVEDLYEEHLRRTPDGQVEYEYQGVWHPAKVRQEAIMVRFGQPVQEEVIVTRHGPIITPLVEAETSKPLALKWTAFESSGGTFRAMVAMNRAKNCAEFREALRSWNVPVLNMVYADTEGNIAYTLAGKVPIRAQGEGKLPMPGWSGDFEWERYIPFDELPHLYNPPSGYIATANNRTVGPDFPYYLGRDYVSGDRTERISELILSQAKIDLAYVGRMQMDQVSPTAQTIKSLVGALKVEDPLLREVVERMRAWDGRLTAESAEAAVYEVLMRQLLWLLFENRLGEHMPRFAGAVLNEIAGYNLWSQNTWVWLRHELLRPNSPWFDLGHGETGEDVLRLALERTVNFLVEKQGPGLAHWRWSDFHQLTFHHVLGQLKPLDSVFNLGPYPVGGDMHTIWATASSLDRVDDSDGMVGPPYRFIADLSDLGRSLGNLVPGQSGQVGSPHYADQIEAWFKGEYHPMLYQREDVIREQEACLELLPC